MDAKYSNNVKLIFFFEDVGERLNLVAAVILILSDLKSNSINNVDI